MYMSIVGILKFKLHVIDICIILYYIYESKPAKSQIHANDVCNCNSPKNALKLLHYLSICYIIFSLDFYM